MSPQNEPSFASALDEFRRGGWIVAVLGAMGVIVRFVFTNQKYRFLVLGRMAFAGSCMGCITFFALYGSGIPQLYYSILCSCSGAMAPQLLEALGRMLEKKTR